VKRWLTKGVFPPQQRRNDNGDLIHSERLSLWRELSIVQTLVKAMLLEALNYSELSENLSRLSKACADSKRKRKPQMLFFSSA